MGGLTQLAGWLKQPCIGSACCAQGAMQEGQLQKQHQRSMICPESQLCCHVAPHKMQVQPASWHTSVHISTAAALAFLSEGAGPATVTAVLADAASVTSWASSEQ